jgi:D-amino-acid dehydrogenase
MKEIGIIGGGIIGLCSAYFLNRSGHRVTIIDQGDLTDGCSLGNAGMIVPSHIIPLAAPGMISKGFRWMFNSTSPFYVKPRLNRDLIKWGYHFYKSSTQAHVERAIPALKEISLLSKSMYQQLAKELPFDFEFQERGLLMLYKNAAVGREELEAAHVANRHGVTAQPLSAKEVQSMEPDIEVRVRGGVYYPGDAHLTPQVLVGGLITYLKTQGVKFQLATNVSGCLVENHQLKSVTTSKGDFSFDELIIAGGAWSGMVATELGISLPMQAGKGYSFTLPDVQKNARIPSIFLEARVAVTPMGTSLRFGGTMEITGIDHSVSMNRVRGIVEAIPNYYPQMNVAVPEAKNIWHGLRPCSPDGLPYIGRSKKISNVIFATGHSMMGLSLGPGTGKLVAEIVDEQKSSMDIAAFFPERFDYDLHIG